MKKGNPTVFGEANTTDPVPAQEKMQHLPLSRLPHGSNTVGSKADLEKMQQIRGAGAARNECRGEWKIARKSGLP